MVYTLIKHLLTKKKLLQLEKFLLPTHTARCIITGPSECGNSVFLTISILYTIDESDKLYICSPSLHQDLYQKLIK